MRRTSDGCGSSGQEESAEDVGEHCEGGNVDDIRG